MPLRPPISTAERDALRIVTRPCPDDPPSLRGLAFGVVAELGGRTLRQLRAVPAPGATSAQVIPFPPLRPRLRWSRPSGDAA